MHFLRFLPKIRFICERFAENEHQFGFGLLSVRIQCICATAFILIVLFTDSITHANSLDQDQA